MQRIVIKTHPDNRELFDNLIKSLGTYNEYPITVVSAIEDDNLMLDSYDAYELGGIRTVFENTDANEIFFLQDSVEIKDPEIFKIAFNSPVSFAMSDQPAPFGMYLGKYKREPFFKSLTIMPKTKMEAVSLEVDFNNAYAKNTAWQLCSEPLRNESSYITYIHGRKNKVIQNKWMIKYKGKWHRNMID